MTITRILRGVGVTAGSIALLSWSAGAAFAQDSADNVDTGLSTQYQAGDGFKLTEEMIFHPRLELQGGYQDNVFYEDDSETPKGSPLLRVGVGGLLTTEEPGTNEEGQIAPKLTLSGDLSLIWHQYLAEEEQITAHNDLGINAIINARVNPQGKVTFQLRDGFVRAVNPPPTETTSELDRDKNELLAGIIVKPGGGALSIYGNLTWTLDRFESELASFANRNSFIAAVGSRWQWLPKTQVNGEVSFGLVSVDDYIKPGGSSTPLRATVGLSTLITAKLGAVLRAGYGNGFYDGANYNSFLALAEARYAIGPTVRVAAGYSRDFADALIGNYRADDAIFARFTAQLVGRVQFSGKADLRFRLYDGLPLTGPTITCTDGSCSTGTPNASSTRNDTLFTLNLDLDVQMTQWLVLGATYTLLSDTTDAVALTPPAPPDSVGFVWHEFMVNLTAKF